MQIWCNGRRASPVNFLPVKPIGPLPEITYFQPLKAESADLHWSGKKSVDKVSEFYLLKIFIFHYFGFSDKLFRAVYSKKTNQPKSVKTMNDQEERIPKRRTPENLMTGEQLSTE